MTWILLGRRSVRTMLSAVAVVGVCCLAPGGGRAAEPEFVGILAKLVDPRVAKDLQLTETQKKKLLEVIDTREGEAVDLAMKLKDAAPAERTRRLAPYRRESEQKGLALLTPEQLARLDELRGGGSGSASPAESAGAEPAGQGKAGEAKPAASAAAETSEAAKPASPAGKPPSAAAKSPGPAESGSAPPGPAAAQRPEPAQGPPKDKDSVKLKFNFRYQPWKEVLDWFARQADLSLVADNPPQGTFNYADDREYTPAEAIDLLNSVLLTKGFTLIRRGRMLMLINLEDGIPPNLLSTIPVSELDKRGEFEIVSVLFTLEKLTAEEAQAEIQKLIGPQGSVVVLSNARQIQVTETAGRLRVIRDVLQRVEAPESLSSNQIRVFDLKHAIPQNVLDVLRQLLDIPADKFASTDGTIRFTMDPVNQRLLVSGKLEKIGRVEEILKTIGVPRAGEQASRGIEESPQLEVYTIAGADPQTALSVLQTLMAGIPEVRLAIETKTGSLIALARPQQQATIRATLAQLQRDARKIEVIQLRRVDPQQAVQSISKLFGGADSAGSSPPQVEADTTTRQLLVRGSQAQIDQIHAMLQKMGELPGEQEGGSGGSAVRTLALSGGTVRAALERIQEIWPTQHTNKIRVVTPSAVIPTMRSSGSDESPPFDQSLLDLLEPASRGSEVPLPEQQLGPLPAESPMPEPAQPPASEPPPAQPTTSQPAPTGSAPAARLRSGDKSTALPAARYFLVAETLPEQLQPTSEPPKRQPAGPAPPAKAPAPDSGYQQPAKEPAPIIVAPGPGGVVIASEDINALNEFEQLLLTLSGNIFAKSTDYTIFYLKHAKAATIAETLDRILAGGSSSSSNSSGESSMLGGMANAAFGNAGGLLGSFLGSSGGTSTITPTGVVKIIPDARLNALIVHANAADVDTIEQLLKILDQKESPEDIVVAPKPRIIPVYNKSAEEIATIIRQVYPDRMITGSSAFRGPSPQDLLQMMRGGGGRRGGMGAMMMPGMGRGGQQQQEEVQRLSIGVDSDANSLIVLAPDPLFQEVKTLVEQLDKAASTSDETMRVVTLGRTSVDSVQQALTAMLGNSAQIGIASSTAGRPPMPMRVPGQPYSVAGSRGSGRGGTGSGRGGYGPSVQAYAPGYSGGSSGRGGGYPGGSSGRGGGYPGGSSGRGGQAPAYGSPYGSAYGAYGGGSSRQRGSSAYPGGGYGSPYGQSGSGRSAYGASPYGASPYGASPYGGGRSSYGQSPSYSQPRSSRSQMMPGR